MNISSNTTVNMGPLNSPGMNRSTGAGPSVASQLVGDSAAVALQPAVSRSLFSQALDMATNGAATAPQSDMAPAAPAATSKSRQEAAADIASTGTEAQAGLPAMAPPLMAAMLMPIPAQAQDTAGAEPQGGALPAMQEIGVQQNPVPNPLLNVHTAAVTLNALAVHGTAGTGESLSAAATVARDNHAAPVMGTDALQPPAAAMPALTAALIPEWTPALNRAQLAVRSASAPLAPSNASGEFATPVSATPTAFVVPATAARDGDRAADPLASATPGPGLAAAANGVAGQASDTIKLNGPAQQWQTPLREALGDRLQTQVGRNGETAVIRLDPPMLGRIDIAIRHTAGSLQVSVTASNTEVLRQLQNIGDNLRSDLAQRQYTDVSVNIGATPRSPAAQAFAEGDTRGQRQPGRQQDDREPGRALSDDAASGSTFAMYEREQH